MIFIDLTLEDQVAELKSYFKRVGGNITEDKNAKLEEEVRQVIDACELCFNEPNEAEVEMVLNDIVSVLVVIPHSDTSNNLTRIFVEKLNKQSADKCGAVCVRVLWVLFQSLDKKNPIRYQIYYHLVIIAQKVDMVRSIFKDVKQLKEHFSEVRLSDEQMQKLLRSLHDGLVRCKHSDIAAKVMIELLSTYTAENASQAKKDAQRCIVTALGDPNTFLLDPLLSLKPISFLKGEPIYELLNIFIQEKYSKYITFFNSHKEFVNNLGLNHSQNVKKMRLLTFMQLAENSGEIPFETIQKELNIGENDVEAFIIEALKTKLVRARMDQTAKKVIISSTMHRTFDIPQWQQLRDVLQSWKLNLNSIDESMKSLVIAPRKPGFPSIPAV